jgi:hypothetical protein
MTKGLQELIILTFIYLCKLICKIAGLRSEMLGISMDLSVRKIGAVVLTTVSVFNTAYFFKNLIVYIRNDGV